MFKSVFQKIFVTYFSILIIVMLILFITITSLADNYVYNEKQKTLESVAYKANRAANEFASGKLAGEQLSEVIDAMGYITNTKIYIVKAGITHHIDLGDKLTDDYLNEALPKVLAGDHVFMRRQYSSEFETRMLFAAYPWRDDTNIYGAILMFSPEKEISSIVANVRMHILIAAIFSVLIGGAVVYFVSRRIVKPIKAVDMASQKMALGQAVDDIDIVTNDEMGSLARSFNNMKHKIQKNEELRQDLISNISHDLRTPITTINGFASGMADGIIKSEDYPKYINIIRQEAKRLISLTSDILESAKIQSGSIELNISNVNIGEIVSAAIDANTTFASSKGIKFEVDVNAPEVVQADSKRLEQIIYNLVNNAVKYSYDQSTVKVTVWQENKTQICVEDRGIGIRQSDLPNIFDRYYRAKSAEGKSGFGLGLCIAKTYTEAHGGYIDVQSTYGKGTRICVTIPNF